MARYNGKDISGAVGPVVFYTVNGKQYMRSKPESAPRRKKSPGSANAAIFGLVSSCGSAIIRDIKGYFLFPFKLATYNVMRGWMRNQYAQHLQDTEWPLVMKGGDMCQVNPEVNLAERLRTAIQITDTGNGSIRLVLGAMNPATDLIVPKKTRSVTLKLAVAAMPFEADARAPEVVFEQHHFNYGKQLLPQKEWLFHTGAKTGDIALVVAALEYNTGEVANNGYSQELHDLPIAVIAMGRLA